jgi:hypothetical protein
MYTDIAEKFALMLLDKKIKINDDIDNMLEKISIDDIEQ